MLNIFLCLFFLLFSLFMLIFIIRDFFKLNYKIDIAFSDNNITIIENAYCCRKKLSMYQKGDIIKLDLVKEKIQLKKKKKLLDLFKVFLVFKGDRRELFQCNENRLTEEDVKYLINYVNNRISPKIYNY